ncbi:class I SAM-dependent methyltransferase [Azospirillum thermophilum]|uniref:SAM-dependent methyltransferase n=1 Tax=Azospirillum thermophilum TaxID=2202148 RepID=A0A2S2CVQ1_9PROT|nr:class I SAM-dependent methyltransferase [Azospirillum thermophilum]AWK88485.1 SAM-dependent methyltransferase [Azospirillum thermophilum]
MTLTVEDRVAADGPAGRRCPSCGAAGMEPFYSVAGVPTNSCMLIRSRREALAFPSGDLELCLCGDCGFIVNARWEEGKTVYAAGYEETQGYSPTFNAFHRALAQDVMARFGLQGARVLEIGCGKGEFLALLVEEGAAEGIGYDPGFEPGRFGGHVAGKLQVVPEYFHEGTLVDPGALVCCKMTLEHVYDVGRFLRHVRSVIGDRGSAVFFMVPDADRILDDAAFWDVYYEHVSYFTADALAGLFVRTGFEPQEVWTGYGGQYLMIAARPVSGSGIPARIDREALRRRARSFAAKAAEVRNGWKDRLAALHRAGKTVALWGSGSKAVSFLTTLGIREEVAMVTDINPNRHGYWLPTSGHPIVSPAELALASPDVVIVVNPQYREEVARDLAALHCHPQILTL